MPGSIFLGLVQFNSTGTSSAGPSSSGLVSSWLGQICLGSAWISSNGLTSSEIGCAVLCSDKNNLAKVVQNNR